MTEEFANKVYDVLVKYGAQPDDKDSFIHHHCKDKYPATEWRFCGAISRYYNEGLQIDTKWIEEYNELVTKLKLVNDE